MINNINKWKIVAIIFISLFILENLLFVWLLNVGTKLVEEENECAINTCADYDSYFYDDDGTCYCYRGDELAYQKYLR